MHGYAMNRDDLATRDLLACMGDASRFRLVKALADGPRCVTELALAVGLSQSCTTRHLQSLERGRLLLRVREGKRVIYRLSPEEPASTLVAWALGGGVMPAGERHDGGPGGGDLHRDHRPGSPGSPAPGSPGSPGSMAPAPRGDGVPSERGRPDRRGDRAGVHEGSGPPIARGASRSSSRTGGDHAGPETAPVESSRRPVRVGDGAAADGLATGAAAPLPPEPEPDRSPSPPRPEIEDYLL